MGVEGSRYTHRFLGSTIDLFDRNLEGWEGHCKNTYFK